MRSRKLVEEKLVMLSNVGCVSWYFNLFESEEFGFFMEINLRFIGFLTIFFK